MGREREVAELRSLLQRQDVRLITLIGPGGVGKTRLAIQVATSLGEAFPTGVAFVPLAAVRDPDLVLPTIAQAVGARSADGALSDRWATLFQGRSLLVLDNLEQVLAAAPHIANLLAACPELSILITSRSPLVISGERTFDVPPLQVPPNAKDPSGSTLDAIASSDAVRLFVERANAARADFCLTETNAAAVAEICRRLEGLPLAIELAAARSRILTPSALLARLRARLPLLTGGARDAPRRLRTMRDAIGWSYDLLDDAEQALFRRVAIFAGGFTVAAIEGIVDLEADGPWQGGRDVLDGISSLVDKSLVRLDVGNEAEPRFTMLETVRELGLEQLAARNEQNARDAHAAYFVSLAETIGPRVGGPDAGEWVGQLTREWPNIRAAADWALDRRDPTTVLRLVSALFHAINGFALGDASEAEARRWLDAALQMGEPVDEALRIDALYSASVFAAVEGDLARADELAKQALVLARGQGDRVREAVALHGLGLAASFRGDLDRMEEFFAQALAIRLAAGDTARAGHALGFLADAALWKGDTSRAAALAAEGWELLDRTGNRDYIGRLLGTLGAIALAERDVVRAAKLYADQLAWVLPSGYARYIADALAGLAGVALASEDAETAVRLLAAAATQVEAAGARSMIHHVQFERTVAAARSRLSPQAFAAAWAAGQSMRRDEAIASGTSVAMSARAAGTKPFDTPEDAFGLSPRERDVLRLLAQGKSNPEIADALFIGRGTVRTHVSNILAKLGAKTRTEASMHARDHGLV